MTMRSGEGFVMAAFAGYLHGARAILPNADRAVIDPRKFGSYALNPSHASGRHKARVFQAALGYDRTNIADLISRIRLAILQEEAVLVRHDPHGEHYRVDVIIEGPKGSARVQTAWLYDRGSDVPRLTTAFVL